VLKELQVDSGLGYKSGTDFEIAEDKMNLLKSLFLLLLVHRSTLYISLVGSENRGRVQ